jgi:hypothetical protein
MLTGPQPKGAHQGTKFTLDILKKICHKQENLKFWTFCLRAYETLATALDPIQMFDSLKIKSRDAYVHIWFFGKLMVCFNETT